jgi:hypothetical protein
VSGSPPARMTMQLAVVFVMAIGCLAYTGPGTPSSSAQSPDGGATALGSAGAIIAVRGTSYEEQCQPVAEAFVDARPPVRAIAGLWSRQAVAVFAHDAKGSCGMWTLAVAPDPSASALDAIESEVRQGVANFGVTASPVPKDTDNGMDG